MPFPFLLDADDRRSPKRAWRHRASSHLTPYATSLASPRLRRLLLERPRLYGEPAESPYLWHQGSKRLTQMFAGVTIPSHGTLCNMQRESTQSVQGSWRLPNATVVVSTPSKAQLLDKHGIERGPALGGSRKLGQRDWRNLRTHLINLDLRNKQHVGQWLPAAGYVPEPQSKASKLAPTIT